MSSNLVKQFFMTLPEDKEKLVIDNNDRIRRRLEELSRGEGNPEGGFVSGLAIADVIEAPEDATGNVIKAQDEAKELLEQSRAEAEELRAQAQAEAERILEEARAQAQAEKDKVSGLIDQASSSINQYSNQIYDAERKALAYEAEIKKKEEDLDYLRQKLAEEIALSQAAANGVWRNISEVAFAEGDRKLLANLIYCEAGGEPYDGQVAVGSVVINRVLSSQFPDTVVGVIYQGGQFSPVASGRLDLALAADKATDRCYQAADAAMSGVTNVGNCVFFRTPIDGLTGINIGGHVFY